MEPKKTLTANDWTGWYECLNEEGFSVVMWWDGKWLTVRKARGNCNYLDSHENFVGPLVPSVNEAGKSLYEQAALALKQVAQIAEFFQNNEAQAARDGDADNITPAECAIRLIRKLRSEAKEIGSADLPQVAKSVTEQIRAAGCWAEDFVLKVVSNELRRLKTPAIALDAPVEWISDVRGIVEHMRSESDKAKNTTFSRWCESLLNFIDACKPMSKLLADDPEVIDRVLDRVSDALREMHVGDEDSTYPDPSHLEIVQGLRARLLRKPFKLPVSGAFRLRTPGSTCGKPCWITLDFYRFTNGTIVNQSGEIFTEKRLEIEGAELVETTEE